MWLLRKGRIIRVDMYIDPCWSSQDCWTASNLYARFRSLGSSSTEAESLASVAVWKQKWNLAYPARVEKSLLNIAVP